MSDDVRSWAARRGPGQDASRRGRPGARRARGGSVGAAGRVRGRHRPVRCRQVDPAASAGRTPAPGQREHLAGRRVARTDWSEARWAVERRKRIGIVFQFFNLVSDLSVADNVELPALLAGVPPKRARAEREELLAELGLTGKERSMPGELSGGEQQRVALARALVNHPPLLLADEPAGSLDSKGTREVMRLLSRFHQRGQTIVLVTHDARLASAADRVISFFDGRIADDAELDPARSTAAGPRRTGILRCLTSARPSRGTRELLRATLRWAHSDLRAHRGEALFLRARHGRRSSPPCCWPRPSSATPPTPGSASSPRRTAHTYGCTPAPAADTGKLADLDGVESVAGPYPTASTTARLPGHPRLRRAAGHPRAPRRGPPAADLRPLAGPRERRRRGPGEPPGPRAAGRTRRHPHPARHRTGRLTVARHRRERRAPLPAGRAAGPRLGSAVRRARPGRPGDRAAPDGPRRHRLRRAARRDRAGRRRGQPGLHLAAGAGRGTGRQPAARPGPGPVRARRAGRRRVAGARGDRHPDPRPAAGHLGAEGDRLHPRPGGPGLPAPAPRLRAARVRWPPRRSSRPWAAGYRGGSGTRSACGRGCPATPWRCSRSRWARCCSSARPPGSRRGGRAGCRRCRCRARRGCPGRAAVAARPGGRSALRLPPALVLGWHRALHPAPCPRRWRRSPG